MTNLEPTRSFGYICPKCGEAVVRSISLFALRASDTVASCPCGKSHLTTKTDGLRFRLEVPCGLCGKSHQAECGDEMLTKDGGIGLSCPEKKQICCYIGEEGKVEASMADLMICREKEKDYDPEKDAFLDEIIMYEILSEIKEIAARENGITCACGCHQYHMDVRPASVDLICNDCGGKMRIPAVTEDDLERLCCRMTLTIKGGK